MKSYKVTIVSTVLEEERSIKVEACNPMDAHKEALYSGVGEFDEIKEIRNKKDVLVYGPAGFVNAFRDRED